MTTKICILNYGSGNVKSVYNVLLSLSKEVKISNAQYDIENASHIILPGVGAFGSSMKKIKEKIPQDILTREVISKHKPFLGICVGMQVLADQGVEFGTFRGLGWLQGEVGKLECGSLPLPHIGWNNITVVRPDALLRGLSNKQDFYFVHSYAIKKTRAEDVIAITDYGQDFISIIGKNNIYGVQFHPEKSQKAGALLLRNFLALS